jgi:hypothetical protein
MNNYLCSAIIWRIGANAKKGSHPNRRDVLAGQPTSLFEFLVAMQAMTEFLLDSVLYVVNCAHSGPPSLAETTEHRLAMAKGAAAAFGSLITVTDLDAQKDLVLEPTRMVDGRERLRAEGEDCAFRIFRFNPKDRLTLVFITKLEHHRRTDETGRDDTINKLLLNIKQRYCGFNPALHNVIALFVSDGTQQPTELAFSPEEQSFIERGLFAIGNFNCPPPGGIQEKEIARLLTSGLEDLLNGTVDFNKLAFLPKSVLEYIADHKDCIQRLIESRSD